MGGDAEDDEALPTAKSAPKDARPAWMASMAGGTEDLGEEADENPAPTKAGMAAWMATMTAEDEDVDEDEEEVHAPAPLKPRMAAWMASMSIEGEDVDEVEPDDASLGKVGVG